ncbi:MAG: urea transporter [Verrucomicrobia bacterium]|nr:urea transporter [Verrucomicrobiota bacterium]
MKAIPITSVWTRLFCGGGWAGAALLSYASIIFSRRRAVGALLLLATFNDPMAGFTGLAGVLISLLFARWMGFNPDLTGQGFLSFNALLCALGVSFLFSFTRETAALYLTLLIAVSILSVLLTVSLNGVFHAYLALPVMSCPFVLATLMLSLATVFITGHPLQSPIRSVFIPDAFCPSSTLALFFQTMGNLFFQNTAAAGLLIAVALLVESRLSFLLAVLGLLEGVWLLDILSFGQARDYLGPVGFNFVLTSIVLGGIFLIPSLASFVYAALGVVLCVFCGAAFQSALGGFNIQPLTVPFNFSALLLLYVLRFRTEPRALLAVDFLSGSAEENLEIHLNRIQRLGHSSIVRMRLPFLGTWTVTQPPRSDLTHQPPWQHAWDFEVAGADGKMFSGAGAELGDYYAYDLPVVAPADGAVVWVTDGVPDNRIGEMNNQQNWGNLLMLFHGYGIYSVLCHLKPGSMKVQLNEQVKQGQLLARCGNSGRSTVPHLHFHVQSQPQIGSPTRAAEFLHYVEETSSGDCFHLTGVPPNGLRLRNFEGDLALTGALRLNVGDEARFDVRAGRRQFIESWKVNVDLYGNIYLESSCRARLYFFISNGVFTAVSFKGTRRCALYGLFLAASRLPFDHHAELQWEDVLGARYILDMFSASLINLLRPFAEPLQIRCRSKMSRESPAAANELSRQPANGEQAVWQVETRLFVRFFNQRPAATDRPFRTLRLSFAPPLGMVSIRMENGHGTKLEATRILL